MALPLVGSIDHLFKEKRWGEALCLLNGEIGKNPANPDLYLARAQAWRFCELASLPGNGKFKEESRRLRVLEDLRSAFETGRPTFSEAPLRSCSLLFHWGYEQEARSILEGMLAQQSTNGAEFFFQRAAFRGRFSNNVPGHQELALEDLERSLALKPSGAAYLLRSLIFRKMADYVRALQDANSALLLDPSNEAAFWARGRLLRIMGNAAGACSDFESAVALNKPDIFERWMEIGEAHLQNKEPWKAAEDFSLAYELEPALPILLRRAQARHALGDIEGASQDAREILRRSPEFPDARDWIQKLARRES